MVPLDKTPEAYQRFDAREDEYTKAIFKP